MPNMTLGDLSQMFQLRRDTVRVRDGLAGAAQELSSLRVSDLGKSVSGNFAPLVAIDQQLSALQGYETNANEAALFTDTVQNALEQMKTTTGDLGLRLYSAKKGEVIAVGSVFASEAAGAFELAVTALNSSAGGRSVFGGTATDRAPLAPASEMLAAIRTAVVAAGATTAADVRAVVDDWFHAPGGGFETIGYQGGADQITGFRVSEGRTIEMPVKADAREIRDQLRGLALGAMLEGAGVTDPDEQVELARIAGSAIIENQDRMHSLQAAVGSAQARIEAAATGNAAEKTALQIARNDVVSIDPYEAATRLQNLQVQLETIYTITARLSGLSLTHFLR